MGSLTYEKKPDEVAMIVFSFIEPDGSEIIDLAAYGFKTRANFDQHWNMLPDLGDDVKTSFVADEYDETDSLDRTKSVTAEAIEAITGRPIAVLIDEGRQALKKVQADWEKERAAKKRCA